MPAILVTDGGQLPVVADCYPAPIAPRAELKTAPPDFAVQAGITQVRLSKSSWREILLFLSLPQLVFDVR